ncbi:hypothetical protein F5Y06DRAFT_308106 [Hypoxylon sp. FL0890]|nr:hypothetical protein F5Y06DRAFT_308106 [Hypoxylon sp. FL0890]
MSLRQYMELGGTYVEVDPDDEEPEDSDDFEPESQDDNSSPNKGGPASVDGDDPDNPPLPPGENRTTIGVEFEFLLAVTRRWPELGDPHPHDGRWQARNLVNYNEENIMFQLTVRNMIIDTLRQNGITAVKSEEVELPFRSTFAFSFTDSLEDRDPNSIEDPENAVNREVLDWVGNYQWDPKLHQEENIYAAVEQLLKQFQEFHAQRGLALHATTDPILERLRRTILPEKVIGNNKGEEYVPDVFYRRARGLLEDEKFNYDRDAATEVDPISVNLPGSGAKYRAWACTTDASVGIEEIEPFNYEIPNGSVPDPPLDESGQPLIKDPIAPPRIYKWFNGELRTPILDYNNPKTFTDIEKACAALRNMYRIHKPMYLVGTGLHVHFGQEKGWTLLHIKKFTTLWLLLEKSLETLHRTDRSTNNIYSEPLRSNSPIAYALRSGVPAGYSRQRLSDLRNRDPQRADYYVQRMEQHVPTTIGTDRFPQRLKEIINQVWAFDTITGLNEGISGASSYGYVRFRLRGDNITDEISPTRTQTLEVRIMQGTLDADHIRRWITICYRIILFSRTTGTKEFHDALEGMLLGTQDPYKVLGIPEDIMAWFAQQRRQKKYFTYPDNDVPTWANPFMVRGHADTHENP